MKILEVRDWTTPLTGIVRQDGAARLHPTTYRRGFYDMEGIYGWGLCQVKSPISVQQLQQREGRRWKTWMVDDPLHWLAMKERVAGLPDGRVVCAGLGLGLMLHHMADSPRFTEITVVEHDLATIELIQPTLPKDPRVTIVEEEWYAWLAENGPRGEYQSILWDLAVGHPGETHGDLVVAAIYARIHMPQAELHCFGLKGGKRTVFDD